MKCLIISVVLAATVLLIFCAMPIYAYSQPSQGTDNATDIIIWYGDNITIESANLTIGSGTINVTISGLEDALVTAANTTAMASTAQQNAFYFTILEVVLILFINLLAYAFRERWLCFVAGLALLVYGLNLWTDTRYMSIIVVLWGLYNIAKAWKDKEGWARK